MSPPRPSTHPAEQYRRAREELAVQLVNVANLLAHLDPDEQFVAGDELLELLVATFDLVDAHLHGAPLRVRPVEVVDTRGRT